MAIPYEAAVSTIVSMFNGTIERDVICTILEANNGHMEKTVECLLAMSGEIPVEETSTSKTNGQPQQNSQVHEDEMYARMLQDQLFVQQLQMYPEFSGVFGSRDFPKEDSEIDILNKLKQMGDAAKLKLKEFAMKLSKNKGPTQKNTAYSTLNNQEDDTEVVAFDSSLAKRTALTSNLDDENEEVPLEKSKKKDKTPSDTELVSSKSKQKGD